MENMDKVRSSDEMVDALGDVRRRRLLVSLLNNNNSHLETPMAVADSAAETENIKRLVSMKHAHLPKLAAYDFIEWDSDCYDVTKGPAFEEIRPLLELLRDHEDELPEDWF